MAIGRCSAALGQRDPKSAALVPRRSSSKSKILAIRTADQFECKVLSGVEKDPGIKEDWTVIGERVGILNNQQPGRSPAHHGDPGRVWRPNCFTRDPSMHVGGRGADRQRLYLREVVPRQGQLHPVQSSSKRTTDVRREFVCLLVVYRQRLHKTHVRLDPATLAKLGHRLWKHGLGVVSRRVLERQPQEPAHRHLRRDGRLDLHQILLG